MPILGNAIINKLLSAYGYVSPIDGAVSQNTTLQIVLDGCAVGAEVISSIVIVALMLFFNIEKILPKEQEEIQERHKQEALDAGLTYISPEERERIDEEEYNKETLAMELETLEKKCTKKGLDYETEKVKYLAKKEKKSW